MNTNLLINNKSVTGDADPYQVINPFNSEIIAEVNQSSIDQVNLAVQAAKDAFPKWSRTSPGERSSMLLKLADAIDSKAEEIAKIESLNTGKPFHLALNDELPAISDVFRYYAGACRNMPGMAAGEYMSGFTSMIRRDPYWCCSIDCTLELSFNDGSLENSTCNCSRKYHGFKTFRTNSIIYTFCF